MHVDSPGRWPADCRQGSAPADAPVRSVPMATGWVTLRENRAGATGMGFIVRAPAAPLSQLVDTIWDWDMPRQAHRFDRMLPSACGQLVIKDRKSTPLNSSH